MKIIGHRGARGLAPENTLAAFNKALECNVDEIECDVRVTRDGVPILLHGSSLQDMAGNELSVRTTPYKELLAHKADLTTLAEAIEMTRKHRVPLMIEVKPRENVQPIIKVLQRNYAADGANKYLLLGSLSQRTLRELHRELPKIEKVVIEKWSGIRAGYRARQLGSKRLSFWHGCLYSGYIRRTTRRGYRIAAWTVNDPKRIKAWAEAGLDAVITDRPDLFNK